MRYSISHSRLLIRGSLVRVQLRAHEINSLETIHERSGSNISADFYYRGKLMPYDPAQRESFAEAAKPLIRWLAENANPQCCV
jgi:hypothetical protein